MFDLLISHDLNWVILIEAILAFNSVCYDTTLSGCKEKNGDMRYSVGDGRRLKAGLAFLQAKPSRRALFPSHDL